MDLQKYRLFVLVVFLCQPLSTATQTTITMSGLTLTHNVAMDVWTVQLINGVGNIGNIYFNDNGAQPVVVASLFNGVNPTGVYGPFTSAPYIILPPVAADKLVLTFDRPMPICTVELTVF
jgi:hypothetical protein